MRIHNVGSIYIDLDRVTWVTEGVMDFQANPAAGTPARKNVFYVYVWGDFHRGHGSIQGDSHSLELFDDDAREFLKALTGMPTC